MTKKHQQTAYFVREGNRRKPSIEGLLESRHTQLLRWDEVRKGLDADGNPVDVYVTLEATVHDCINMHKLANPAQSCDAELLHNFMAINWAYVSKGC